MKTIFSIPILILLVQLSFAQYPVPLNHYSLVNADGINENLLLFLPDTVSQILVNPARAASYNNSFIYTNYYSTGSLSSTSTEYMNETIYLTEQIILSSSNLRVVRSTPIYLNAYNADYSSYSSAHPDFSIVSLFNAYGSKWLLNFSFGMAIRKRETQTDDSDIYSYSDYDYLDSEISSNFNSSKNEDSNTEIVLSKIGKSYVGNYSLGIFASYHQDNGTSNTKYDDHYLYRNYTNIGNTSYDYLRRRVYNRVTDIEDYHIGLSFSLNSEKSDYIGRISYLYSNIDDYDKSHEYYTRLDSVTNDTLPEYLLIRTIDLIEDSDIFNKYHPKNYLIENYFQRNVSILNDQDHIFVRMNGYYAKDTKTYQNDSRIYDKIVQYYNNSGSQTDVDTLKLAKVGDKDLENWAVKLSLGYITSYKMHDIDFLAGINPKLELAHLEDVNANTSIMGDYNKIQIYTLRFPVHINYTPRYWIDIYCGINYQFSYSYTERKYEYVALKEIYTEPGRINEEYRKTKRIYEYTQSSRSSYLGVNLKHKSGLRCLIYFEDNISNYKTWNISLGYHF